MPNLERSLRTIVNMYLAPKIRLPLDGPTPVLLANRSDPLAAAFAPHAMSCFISLFSLFWFLPSCSV